MDRRERAFVAKLIQQLLPLHCNPRLSASIFDIRGPNGGLHGSVLGRRGPSEDTSPRNKSMPKQNRPSEPPISGFEERGT